MARVPACGGGADDEREGDGADEGDRCCCCVLDIGIGEEQYKKKNPLSSSDEYLVELDFGLNDASPPSDPTDLFPPKRFGFLFFAFVEE